MVLPEPAMAALAAATGGTVPRLERLWPFRSDGLLACLGGERGWKRAWAVVDGGSGELPPAVRTAIDRGRAVGLPGGAAGFSVRHDPELPQLRRVLAGRPPRELTERLPAHASVRARLVGYKPLRRAMVRLRCERGAFRRTFYLKLLRPREHEAAAAAYEALSGGEGRLAIAQPIANLGSLNGLLWRSAGGSGLGRVEGGERHKAMASLGSVLASIHQRSAVLRRRHSRERELATGRRWIEVVARVLPAGSPELATLREAHGSLEERAGELPAGSAVPAHRDFHPGQCLVRRGRARVLDLDTAALAERELDFGNLLAHLWLPEYRAQRVALSRAFRSGYGRWGEGRLLQSRVRFYELCSRLRLSCVYRFRPGRERFSRRLAAEVHRQSTTTDDSRRAI